MTLLRRIGYYLGGFSIGLVLLAFFLSGKKTTCDYGPSARVKKNIRSKTMKFSSQAEEFISFNNMDSILIDKLIAKGAVKFSESNTRLDSCKIYIINNDQPDKSYKLTIENCDSIATVKRIEIYK